MGRRRKAWLWNGDGKRVDRGRELPGVYVRYYEYPAGRDRRNRSKCFDSIRAARKWVKIYNARHDLGEIEEPIPIEFADAVEEYMRTLGRRAAGTRVQYGISLGLLGRVVGDKEVGRITGVDIDAFVRARFQTGSEATVAKHIRAARGYFNWAIRQGYAPRNPIADATDPPTGKHVRHIAPVSEATLTKIVDACDTAHRKLAVQLAITTGLDRGVIERLTAGQIDRDRRCVVVMRPKTKRRTNRQVVVPVHVSLWPLLQPLLDETPAGRPLLKGLARQAAKRDWWKLAVAAAGAPGLTFADLRKLASSRLQTVMPLTAAAALLGHNPQVAADHYSVVSPDVVARLDSLPLPGSPARRSEPTEETA